MDFSKYLIASDLDGTLLARDGAHVPQRSLDAIARFKAGGGRFTVATGRLHMTITGPIPEPEKLLSAPAMLANGAYFYDYTAQKHLCEVFLTTEEAAAVLDFVKTYAGDIPCRVSTPYRMRTATPFGLVKKDMAAYRQDQLEILPYEAWRLDDWYKIVFRDEPEKLAKLRAQAEACLGGKIGIFATGPTLIEMQPLHSTKGLALPKLRGLMGADDLILIACGDFENDLEMLRAADIAIAPANAIDSVKAVADYVLCDCEDGLIADVIEGIEAGRIVVKRA